MISVSSESSDADTFKKWFDAHQTLKSANDNDGDIARADAIAVAGLNRDYAVMAPPERPHGPWLVPGTGNTL